jgi:MFS family permease
LYLRDLIDSLMTPSIGLLLIGLFICVFTLASFETTLGMLIKYEGPFRFNWGQVCLTYASVGAMLVLIQGGVVRPLARRVSEGHLAETGALIEIVGFGVMIQAIRHSSVGLLFTALVLIVSGFAFMQPTLNSLLSRRTDPARQGTILGVGQSVNALARIFGSLVGIPLLMHNRSWPFYVGAVLMAVALVLVAAASRRGKDFAAKSE